MAATGYTPISLYYSTTASAVPTAGNLANGELALNIADMKLYAKNSSGTVTLLASNASTTGVDSLSFGTTGLTPNTATTGAITVAGTLNVANGGTGSTSLTAGRVLFGAGTSAVGNSANLFWDSGNNRLGIGTATPSGALDVTGRSYFRASGGNTVLTLLNTSGGDGSISVTGTSTTMNYGFSTFSTSNALYIQNNGYVGIGTSSPATNLHVVGGVRASNGAGTVFSTLSTDGVYASGTDLYLLAPTGYSTIIYANNSEKFRVGTAGQLGIGGANYGTSGQVLTSQGSGSAPTWATAGGGGTYSAFSFAGTTSNSFNV